MSKVFAKTLPNTQPNGWSRPHQKKKKNLPPVNQEDAQIAIQQSSKPTKPVRKTGLAASLGTPISRGNSDAFKPLHLTDVSTKERNDPLILESILVDGLNGAVPCSRERKFQLDFSQYVQIIKSSYYVMTRLDRGLQKYMSYSVYQYYCVALLWKRIRFILTNRGDGVNEYEVFKRSLPPMSIPKEIGLYLDGIGNIDDYNHRSFILSLQDDLRITLINGISGTFGQVDPVTHTSYETLPSPFVAVYRILQDMAMTTGQQHRPRQRVCPRWDLPADLRPNLDANYLPNRNLLCWDRSTALTNEQMSMCQDSRLDVTFEDNVPVFNTDGVSNVEGFPIIYPMLLQVSELLSGSKSAYNNHTESGSFLGSLAQIGYIEREKTDYVDWSYVSPISELNGMAIFYTEVNKHVCSATTTFRYRIKRVLRGVHDSLCYAGSCGGQPPGWLVNSDRILNSVPEWNQKEFRSLLMSGRTVCDRYSERIRHIAPRELT